jgi:hypothetical protein
VVTGATRIEGLEAGRARLADGSVGAGSELVVPVRDVVPAWLVDLVSEAGLVGASVVVEAEPPADLEGEVLDGWEIGVCTAALGAGATDVLGIAPRRVARVREVGDLLAAPAPVAEPGVAP